MIQSFGDQELREDEVQQRVSNLQTASTSVKSLFQDPTKCTFVCVCIPEFLSVYETERLIQELCKHGIDASNIVVNQVLFPEDCGEGAANLEAGGDRGLGPAELEGLAASIS